MPSRFLLKFQQEVFLLKILQKISFENFGKRFCAYLLDMLLLYIVFAILGYILKTLGLVSTYTFAGISYLLTILYFAVLESGEHQATLGKRILGLVVIRSDTGEKITFKRAAVRNIVRLINIPIYCLGYLPILFTAKHQGLHDFIVHTQVVSIDDIETEEDDEEEPEEVTKEEKREA